MPLAPVALFVYNRPTHTRRTVAALRTNARAQESALCIFSDGAKGDTDKDAVKKVREYIRTIEGFKSVEIIERERNGGLSRSIIAGVTNMVNRFGQVIVLEDDLVTSPHFLEYMNDGLTLYENEEEVISIHGYTYPVGKPLPETFFLKNPGCWGWATWKRGWNLFEPNGAKLLAALRARRATAQFDFENSFHFTQMLERVAEGRKESWAVRWYASAFLADKLTLYPGMSLIDNIGHDTSGTHGDTTNLYRTTPADRKIRVERIPAQEEAWIRNVFVRYFRSIKPGIIGRIILKIRRWL